MAPLGHDTCCRRGDQAADGGVAEGLASLLERFAAWTVLACS
jgi:hypothetical protein